MSSRDIGTQDTAPASDGDLEHARTMPGGAQPSPQPSPAEVDTDIDEARARAAVASKLFGRSSAPIRVGRFAVLSELGRGGMGVVYSGFDEQLDRKVAIKLLQFGRGTDGPDRTRLLREAQAMAKLSHPNVVQVYEVGEHDGQLFVAMEFIAGSDLRKWLGKGPHSTAAVIEVLTAAGRGLAAAHAAGLVHRDFKPENALMEEGGRVRITDFGLTRIADAPDDEHNATLPDAGDDVALTRTGAVLGTPAYMAPEQWHGSTADERSDQFAFCVTLFEALHGSRPFSGATISALSTAVCAGEVEGLDDPKIPERVRKILRRGLSTEADARFATMDELLTALTHDPWRSRGRFALVGSAVLGLGLAAWQATNDEEVRCEDDGALGTVWSDDTRDAIETGFDASTRSYAPQAKTQVLETLDAWMRDWTTMRTEACRATWISRTQSERALDLRMACLDERLDTAKVLVDQFAAADDRIVDGAVEALGALPGLERCTDLEGLASAYPPPDPKIAEEVEALTERLRRATVLVDAGWIADGRDDVLEIAEAVEPLGYPPLLGYALVAKGDLENADGKPYDAEKTLRRALPILVEAGDAELQLDAWLQLLEAVQLQDTAVERGLAWELPAMAMVSQAHRPDYAEAAIDAHVAVIYVRLNRIEQALARIEKAAVFFEAAGEWAEHANMLAIEAAAHNTAGDMAKGEEASLRAVARMAEVFGGDHEHTLSSKLNLADTYRRQGKLDEAATVLDEVLAGRRRLFGEDSPQLIPPQLELGTLELMRGQVGPAGERIAEALAASERHYPEGDVRIADAAALLAHARRAQGDSEAALPLMEKAHRLNVTNRGKEHPRTLQQLGDVGLTLLDVGRAEDALERLTEAVEGLERVDPDSTEINRLRLAIGSTLYVQRELAEAERYTRAACTALEAVGGEREPTLPYGLAILGDILSEAERPKEAERVYRRATDLFERFVGKDSVPVGLPLVGLGDLLVDEGRHDEAQPILERGVELVSRGGVGDAVICRGHFATARLAWAQGKRDTARTEANAAWTCLQDGVERERVDAWLAERGWSAPTEPAERR